MLVLTLAALHQRYQLQDSSSSSSGSGSTSTAQSAHLTCAASTTHQHCL
jgi:hypothetical protein